MILPRSTIANSVILSDGTGEKVKYYPCCDAPQGAPGCREGPHVFKEDDFLSLHGRVPFIETPKDIKSTKAHSVVAMDCEMVTSLRNDLS
jgi:RNA exonuclease 1